MEQLKWCIKRTSSNYEEVNAWANRQPNVSWEYTACMGYIHSEPVTKPLSLWEDTIKEGFTQITLDEFRVLTNPEKYNQYSVKNDTGYRLLTGVDFTNYNNGSYTYSPAPTYPVISVPVYIEWQRQRGIYQCETPYGTVLSTEPLQQAPDELGDMMFKHVEYHKDSLQAFISFSHSLGFKLTFRSTVDPDTGALTTEQLFEPIQQEECVDSDDTYRINFDAALADMKASSGSIHKQRETALREAGECLCRFKELLNPVGGTDAYTGALLDDINKSFQALHNLVRYV